MSTTGSRSSLGSTVRVFVCKMALKQYVHIRTYVTSHNYFKRLLLSKHIRTYVRTYVCIYFSIKKVKLKLMIGPYSVFVIMYGTYVRTYVCTKWNCKYTEEIFLVVIHIYHIIGTQKHKHNKISVHICNIIASY